ncbi:MAG: DUF4160 domain-containing protein [Tepidiformaceae bacterium]
MFVERGYRVFFYSDGGTPREPMHVHITKGRGKAKFWIEPQLRVAIATRFNDIELNELERLIMGHIDDIRSMWDGHFRS